METTAAAIPAYVAGRSGVAAARRGGADRVGMVRESSGATRCRQTPSVDGHRVVAASSRHRRGFFGTQAADTSSGTHLTLRLERAMNTRTHNASRRAQACGARHWFPRYRPSPCPRRPARRPAAPLHCQSPPSTWLCELHVPHTTRHAEATARLSQRQRALTGQSRCSFPVACDASPVTRCCDDITVSSLLP